MGTKAQALCETDEMVHRARLLLAQNDHKKAVILGERALVEDPESKEALYICAVCKRYLNQAEHALSILSRLEAVQPEYARLYQERGHCYRNLGDAAAALIAYERAVTLNPALHASWRALIALYCHYNRSADAERASVNYQYLAQLPEALLSVASHLHEGHLFKAERLCRQFLLANEHHIEGMRLLADIGVKLNVLDDAEYLLKSCVTLAPGHLAARYDYVNVLHRRQKYAEALEHVSVLRSTDPASRRFDVLYANQCVAIGNYQAALKIYDAALDVTDDTPELHLARANTLKIMGRQREAIAAYAAACRARPDFGEAYWSLANLKTYRFGRAEIEHMRACLSSAELRPIDRYHFCFALAKGLEDKGDWAAAFTHYQEGNQLKKRERPYFPEFMERDLHLQMQVCTPELFAAKAGSGCSKADPIFIVGMPRAGSTLLEQILAAHSQVDGTHELSTLLALAHGLDRRRRVDEAPSYPSSLQDLTSGDFAILGERYLRETRVYRTGKPYFIDKMPNNFRHIGLIHLILPNAKIIDARRQPMACCFSCFKQLFVEGQEFTYDLAELGRYYRKYVELMTHWDTVLPGKVLRVHYEDVVADLERSVRRILTFCGLEFELSCLEFHKFERTVRTASSEQVRQPIFRSGLDQWRPFATYLEPLKQELGILAVSRDGNER